MTGDFGFMKHDLVAAGLQIVEQARAASAVACWKSCIRTMPLPCFFSFAITDLTDLLGLAHLEVERIEVGREDGDIALAEIGDQLRRMPQRRGSGRRERSARRPPRRTALMPFSISSLPSRHSSFLGQILGVAPGVAADGVAGGGDLLEDFGMPDRVLADREEYRLGALRRERREHRRRILRPGAVIEGQHDLAVRRKSMLLKCSKPKPGPPVVSISTTRATPSASGLPGQTALAIGGWRRRGGGRRRCAGTPGLLLAPKPAERRQAPLETRPASERHGLAQVRRLVA